MTSYTFPMEIYNIYMYIIYKQYISLFDENNIMNMD